MNYHVCAGTHHKTGTVWMASVFKEMADRVNTGFVHLPESGLRDRPGELETLASNSSHLIFFDTHSRFPSFLLQSGKVRGIHVIRHPKDVAISCARYHSFSEEEWLHRPWNGFAGRTYQEVINEIPAFKDRVMFELQNIAGREIREMASFQGDSNFMQVKYEDLMQDRSTSLWHDILFFLGFNAAETCEGILAFYNNSIMFNKKIKKKKHVQDGSPAQWTSVFDDSMNRAFEQQFPGMLEKLGYA